MKKFIKQVTVTGASDDTSFEDMLKIQEEFPFVEWGILLSRRQAGITKRFPSFEWINKLHILIQNCIKYRFPKPLKLSGHLCGEFVNEILTKNIGNEMIENLIYSDMFDRIQINTHGEKYVVDIEKLECTVKFAPHVQFIAQYDNINSYIHNLNNLGYNNIAALYDLSHGAGVLPESWDKPLEGIYTGYAGGLSPENLEEQLQKIEEQVNEPIWIDAETWLRTNDRFDLDKVRQFLKIAESRVI